MVLQFLAQCGLTNWRTRTPRGADLAGNPLFSGTCSTAEFVLSHNNSFSHYQPGSTHHKITYRSNHTHLFPVPRELCQADPGFLRSLRSDPCQSLWPCFFLSLYVPFIPGHGNPGTCATPPLLCTCAAPVLAASPSQPLALLVLPAHLKEHFPQSFLWSSSPEWWPSSVTPTLPVSGNDFSAYELPGCDFSLALILVKCILVFWKTTDYNTATYTVRHEIYDWPVLGSTP